MKKIPWIIAIFGICLCGPPISSFATDLPLTGDLNGNYYSDGNITTQGTCTVPMGADVKCSAFGEIFLNPGFQTMPGSFFDANINNQNDTDNDGLPDAWELLYFGSLQKGPDDDVDGDLITNIMEFSQGKDPLEYNMEDINLGGLLDNGQYYSGNKLILTNATVGANSNVLLKANCTIHIRPELHVRLGAVFRIVKPGDCDWLPDDWEMQYFGTLMYDHDDDPDGDGLSNYWEHLIGSDPTVFDSDTDDDGLADWWELIHFGNLGQTAEGDADGDGFNNYVEFNGGSDPESGESKPKVGTYYLYDSLGRIKKIYRVK